MASIVWRNLFYFAHQTFACRKQCIDPRCRQDLGPSTARVRLSSGMNQNKSRRFTHPISAVESWLESATSATSNTFAAYRVFYAWKKNPCIEHGYLWYNMLHAVNFNLKIVLRLRIPPTPRVFWSSAEIPAWILLLQEIQERTVCRAACRDFWRLRPAYTHVDFSARLVPITAHVTFQRGICNAVCENTAIWSQFAIFYSKNRLHGAQPQLSIVHLSAAAISKTWYFRFLYKV